MDVANGRGSRNVGFYKCEECSKSFNRMASYEAHIRMHAEDELDILDVVFNYSGRIHENNTAATAHHRETGSKKTVRSLRKSTTISKSSPPLSMQQESPNNKTPISPLMAAQREPLAGSVGNSATFKIIDLLLDRNTMGNVAAVTTSEPDLSMAKCSEAYSRPSPFVTLPATKVLRGGYTPSQVVLETPTTIEAGGGCDSDGESLLVKIPLKFCSAGLLGKPVINLTKQTFLKESSSSQLQSVSSSSSSITPGQLLPYSTQPSQAGFSDSMQYLHSNGLPHHHVKKDDKSLSINFPPSPQRMISKIDRFNDVASSEISDLPQLYSKKEATLCIKKRKPTTSSHFKCSICHRLLSSKSSLKRHNMLHTGEKPFKCSICDRRFTQPHHRHNHERTHYITVRDHIVSSSSSSYVKQRGPGGSVSSSVSSCSPEENEVRMYKCHVCDMAFVSVRSLRKHLTIHDTKRSFHCELCGMWFLKKGHLDYHVQAFHAPHRYCCQHCPKKYSRPEYLQRHMLQHTREDTTTNVTTGKIKYMCKLCPKVCCSLSGLTRHQAVHVTPSPYSYEKTKKGGKIDKVITRHLEENGKIMSIREVFPPEHAGLEKPVSVGKADCSTYSSNDLVLELDSDSDESVASLTEDTESGGELDTDMSGVDGTTEESSDEMMLEDGSKSIVLNGVQCNGEEEEEEVESEGVMSPLRIDSSDESTEENDDTDHDQHVQFIQCNSNGVKSNLVPTYRRNPHNHLKSKGGIPQFKCEWCGRMFLKKDYLRQHYSLHQQVPHQCHICGKVFMSRRYLKRHLYSKHDE